ncbi:glycosyltransferase family 9 protein [Fluviibacter phosphoraccumulans]|nr:glycosyltransferase family 9 protein [Fluviibacter phosphoraccumulans]
MLDSLKARYERRHPLALLLMALTDGLCWLVSGFGLRAQSKSLDLSAVKRVLLVNPAHMGDVVISTAAIRRLKDANPTITVGFLVGSWAKLALDGHPGIDKLYVVDHWRLNRSNASRSAKLWRYWMTWRQSRAAIKRDGYDLGILLNSFSPNLASLLWSANVPMRVGYVSVGEAPLLNIVLPKPASTQSEQSIQLNLLEACGFYGRSECWLKVPDEKIDVLAGLRVNTPFVVLHPGTGNPAKTWLPESWIVLARHFRGQGLHVVLTGQGAAEEQLASRIANNSGAQNLADKLTWQEWLALLAKADLVVGVDSVVGHVCAAIGRPFVGVYSGIGSIARWAPTGARTIALTKPMPCSPCHTRPCRERTCITAVGVEDVQKAANQLLRTSDAHII